MKTLFFVLAFILCQGITHAQDYSQLPELPVWYELENTPYGKAMSYFPNFDTARGGFNALIHYITGQQNPTWYNRYKGDTENMFQWGGSSSPSKYGDFNGDGITDYYNSGLYEFYESIQNSTPPQPQAKYKYYDKIDNNGYNYGSFIVDIDNDGKSDVIVKHSATPTKEKQLGSIIFGNSDLTKMQVVALPHTSDSVDCILDAYTNNGKARMITLAVDESNKSAKLVLWEIRFITAGSNIKVEYSVLSQSHVKNEIMNSSMLFEHEKHHVIMFNNSMYSLGNDKIVLLYVSKMIGTGHSFRYSMADKNNEGWSFQYDYENPDFLKRINVLFSGDVSSDTIPFAKLKAYFKGSDPEDLVTWTDWVGIGDVNNDGFGDIAVYYTGIYNRLSYNRFVIYLGIDKSVGVNEPRHNTIQYTLQSNNPISRNGKLQVSLTAHPNSFLSLTLYDMRGARVAELWNGLSEGIEQKLSLDISTLQLAQGMYNLRLQSGTQFTDKAIIIE